MMTETRATLATLSLIALSLFYIVMLGGGAYEQLNVTHTIASAPPRSLAMLQGPYGFNPIKFWVIFRPLTILLFLLAIAFNWNSSLLRRKLLLTAFGIDMATTVATFLYFAPETGVITSVPFDPAMVDNTILKIAQRWENLNYLRLAAFFGGAVLMLYALSHKPEMNSQR